MIYCSYYSAILQIKDRFSNLHNSYLMLWVPKCATALQIKVCERLQGTSCLLPHDSFNVQNWIIDAVKFLASWKPRPLCGGCEIVSFTYLAHILTSLRASFIKFQAGRTHRKRHLSVSGRVGIKVIMRGPNCKFSAVVIHLARSQQLGTPKTL